MSSDLQIVVSQEQGRVPVTVFAVKGQIGANTYEKLEAQASEAYEAGMRHLLLDLTGVTYMSSAGLRAIHLIFSMLRANTANESDEAMRKGVMAGTFKSPNLKLLNPSPDVLRVIEIQGFDMFLEIHKNRKEAIASF